MRNSLGAVVLTGLVAMVGLGPAVHALPAAAVRAAAPTWTCRWAPTMDDNWHNDALCSNGVTRMRPHLRPGDTYITREELMGSARAWARARNAGR